MAGSSEVDGGHRGEPGHALVERCVGSRTERGQQPRSPVVRPGAAEPDDHGLRAGLRRGQQQLPDAVRRGPLGVLASGQVQAARLCALDVRRALAQQDRARDRRAVRPADRDGEQLAPEGGGEYVDEPGAAVGHRRQVEHVVG